MKRTVVCRGGCAGAIVVVLDNTVERDLWMFCGDGVVGEVESLVRSVVARGVGVIDEGRRFMFR